MIQAETDVARFFQLYAEKAREDRRFPHWSRNLLIHFFQPIPMERAACASKILQPHCLSESCSLIGSAASPPFCVSLHETQLDARYVLAKTTWRFDFARENSGELEQVLADSTFLVDTGEEEFKIVMYMAHQDIMQVLRDRGILRD